MTERYELRRAAIATWKSSDRGTTPVDRPPPYREQIPNASPRQFPEAPFLGFRTAVAGAIPRTDGTELDRSKGVEGSPIFRWLPLADHHREFKAALGERQRWALPW